MKTKSQQCPLCGKMFKRVKTHERFCPERQDVTTTFPILPKIYTERDMTRRFDDGVVFGLKKAEEQQKQRFNEGQLKAITAAAQAVDAIAHMMGDLRIQQ